MQHYEQSDRYICVDYNNRFLLLFTLVWSVLIGISPGWADTRFPISPHKSIYSL